MQLCWVRSIFPWSSLCTVYLVFRRQMSYNWKLLSLWLSIRGQTLRSRTDLCVCAGPGGPGGGEGGRAEGYLFTRRRLPVAGQPGRTDVWRGDVSAGLPCSSGAGCCFLSEKLSPPAASPSLSSYCFNEVTSFQKDLWSCQHALLN